MTTLELDLAVSSNGQLIVSHEPWFNTTICTLEGTTYDENTPLYSLTTAQIAAVDCGTKGNPDFPNQATQALGKPTLRRVVAYADSVARAMSRSLPNYNIEIKSKSDYDGTYTPPVREFVRLVRHEISDLGIESRATVQSFDRRALRELHNQDSTLRTAYLSVSPLSAKREILDLGFTPDVYSPYHLSLRPETVEELHEMGVLVIPWTVNDVTRMSTLMRWGVDGLITDYPDRLAGVL